MDHVPFFVIMLRLKKELTSLDNSSLFDFIQSKKKEGVIDLGIGDVVHPLNPLVAKAIIDATLEMTTEESRRGYGPKSGYPFLKEAIHRTYFSRLPIDVNDIYVNDGIISDFALFYNLFEGRIALQYPCYPPQFENTKRCDQPVELLPCVAENGFKPHLPLTPADLIILCSPHNPTGVALTKSDLKQWVDYAIEHEALILFDAAYQSFVYSPDVPKSIYEIEGAERVAIEFCSFSKSAGFTGLRCGYFVCPSQIEVSGKNLGKILSHIKSMSCNGVAYPIQRGAEMALTPECQKDIHKQVNRYKEAARYMRQALIESGFEVYGGIDAPYLWLKVPSEMTSIQFFEYLLDEANLMVIPGSGFGSLGEGYVRISSFVTMKTAKEAITQLRPLCKR